MPNIIILDEPTMAYVPHKVCANADLIVLSPQQGMPEGYRVLKKKKDAVPERMFGSDILAVLSRFLTRAPEDGRESTPLPQPAEGPENAILVAAIIQARVARMTAELAELNAVDKLAAINPRLRQHEPQVYGDLAANHRLDPVSIAKLLEGEIVP